MGLNTIDKHVGNRIRERREALQKTLIDLANELRISVDDLRRYEAGIKRVSAHELQTLATHFRVGLDFFFVGIRPQLAGAERESHEGIVVPSEERDELMRAFQRIHNPALRQKLIELAHSFSTMGAIESE